MNLFSTGMSRRISRQRLAVVSFWLLLFLSSGLYAARPPLQVDSLPGLYQRVLARPGVKILQQPKTDAKVIRPYVSPLSIYYVYAQKGEGDDAWVEVGESSQKPLGWMRVSQTVKWNRALVGIFSNSADRDRVLFFRNKEQLDALVRSDKTAEALNLYGNVLNSDLIPEDFPVIAREPEHYVDFQEQFYILPILDHTNSEFASSSREAMLLKVAAVRLNEDNEDTGKDKAKDPSAGDALKTENFKAGVAFVIDSTKSMGPYIERTRRAIRQIYDQLKQSRWKESVSFGLVAYRDSNSLAPGLEYDAKVIAPLTDVANADRFLSLVDRVEEASASSVGFGEDPFQGIATAIEKLDWKNFNARYVVLITDASARDAGDPNGATGLDSYTINSYAEKHGIRLLAIHLKTFGGARPSPETGKIDHQVAKQQYIDMTTDSKSGKHYYFAVERGSEKAFAQTVTVLTEALSQQMRVVAGLAEPEQPDEPAGQEKGCREDDVKCRTGELIRAFAVEYFGRETGAQAPSLIESWVVDRDIRNDALKSIHTRVLMRRSQLQRLYENLNKLIREAQKDEADDLFEQLKSVVGGNIADPDRPGSLTMGNILAPFLDGLPYKSPLLNVTRDDWRLKSSVERDAQLRRIYAKLELYRDFYRDEDLWIKLGNNREEWLYPIPLEDLP